MTHRIVKLHNGRIILVNGDCLDVLPKVRPKTVDMVFADLPYGTTQNKWDTPIDLKLLWYFLTGKRWSDEIPKRDPIVKLNAAMVFTAQTPFDKVLGASNIEQLRYERIWDKGRITGHLNAKRQPLKQHENILVFYSKQSTYNPQFTFNGKPYKNTTHTYTSNYGDASNVYYRENDGRRYPTSILPIYVNNKHTIHPTEKPLELLLDLIKTYTNENDVVLDPTFGSNTTAEACIKLNRRYIGIERDQEYFDIGVTRAMKAIDLYANINHTTTAE
jgi:site-specific DNA-methyltransferase (adenine-specific)